MVAQTPEREFQVNIASNATFEGCQGQILAQLGQKWEKTDYFQEFHFRQSNLKSQN